LEKKDGFTTVSIPTALFRKAEDRIKGTHFDSVSTYVTYLLGEVMSENQEREHPAKLTREDEEKIRQRLRALGYNE
jgi:Arc/MetJ-type ribon-helix-helix transcriptional regulator